jgi:hypothetical protein
MCDRSGFPAGHPLSDTVTRRGAGSVVSSSTVTGGGHGRWTRLDKLAVPTQIASWLRDTRAVGYDQQHAAAVNMCDVLTKALLDFTSQAVYLDGCAPDLTPSNVWVRRDGAAIVQVALGHGTAAVIGDRPAADHPDAVVVADAAALDAWVAERIAAAFTPVFTAIHEQTRMGLRVMWGRVADLLHAQMLRAAKDSGYDTDIAWRRAERLTDAIAQAVPKMSFRPRPFPVQGFDRAGGDWDGTWLVFGTCCFRYKADPARGFCNVCPLISDTGRSFAWMDKSPPAPRIAAAP